MSKRYLTTKEAADYLTISASTLAKLRMGDRGPVFCKTGFGSPAGKVIYQIQDLDDWMEGLRRRSVREGLARHG